MKGFEYKITKSADEEELNELGKKGWEIIHIHYVDRSCTTYCYLKRIRR